jgi:hypothetical protein
MFPKPIGYNDLTPKIGSYTVALAYNSLCFWNALEIKAPVDFVEVRRNMAALVRNSANDISQSIH